MNNTDFQQFLQHGSAKRTAQPKIVHAGPWTAAYIDGDLRYIKFQGCEAIRRIYAAVRDQNWNTIPGNRTNERIEVDADSFRISYQSHHQQNEIDFVWQSSIVGTADGAIIFEFYGEARSDFYRNRIGYCVLHPSEICSGRQAEGHYTNGRSAPLTFPRFVAAKQPIPGFHDLVGLSHRVIDDCWCTLSFEGDIFETEDQRNWIDASFKTYSTPLSLPFPALVKSGTRIQQKVTLRYEDRGKTPATSHVAGTQDSDNKPVKIEFELDAQQVAWPKIGSMMPDPATIDASETIGAVQRLKLDHLRIDAIISDVPLNSELSRQINLVAQINASIELVIDLKDRSAEDQSSYLTALSQLLKSANASICRIAVFGGPKPNVTSQQAVQMVRQHLQWMGVPIGGGSNTDLYQYQLDPIQSGIDFLCWSMNPQVHASDDYSLAESPTGAWEQTQGMRHMTSGMPISISPITLKPRFNPVEIATQKQATDSLPSSVDPRQMSLLGAAWTVGMLKAASESGCASATLFEAAGWKGFSEGTSGSAAPDLFPSNPEMLFPVFYLFEYIGQLARPLTVQLTRSSDLDVTSLLLISDDERHLVLGNMSGETRVVSVGTSTWDQLAVLDLTSMENGLKHPTQSGFQFKSWQNQELELPSYAIAILKSGSS